jgi:hypothetical protein
MKNFNNSMAKGAPSTSTLSQSSPLWTAGPQFNGAAGMWPSHFTLLKKAVAGITWAYRKRVPIEDDPDGDCEWIVVDRQPAHILFTDADACDLLERYDLPRPDPKWMQGSKLSKDDGAALSSFNEQLKLINSLNEDVDKYNTLVESVIEKSRAIFIASLNEPTAAMVRDWSYAQDSPPTLHQEVEYLASQYTNSDPCAIRRTEYVEWKEPMSESQWDATSYLSQRFRRFLDFKKPYLAPGDYAALKRKHFPEFCEELLLSMELDGQFPFVRSRYYNVYIKTVNEHNYLELLTFEQRMEHLLTVFRQLESKLLATKAKVAQQPTPIAANQSNASSNGGAAGKGKDRASSFNKGGNTPHEDTLSRNQRKRVAALEQHFKKQNQPSSGGDCLHCELNCQCGNCRNNDSGNNNGSSSSSSNGNNHNGGNDKGNTNTRKRGRNKDNESSSSSSNNSNKDADKEAIKGARTRSKSPSSRSGGDNAKGGTSWSMRSLTIRSAEHSAAADARVRTLASVKKLMRAQKPLSLRGVADSGAQVNAAPLHLQSQLRKQSLRNVEREGMVAQGAFGNELPIIGVGDLNDHVNDVHLIDGMQEILYSLPQLRAKGNWIIIAPDEAKYEAAGYVINHASRKVIMTIDRDFTMDPSINIPKDMPRVELPLIPQRSDAPPS